MHFFIFYKPPVVWPGCSRYQNLQDNHKISTRLLSMDCEYGLYETSHMTFQIQIRWHYFAGGGTITVQLKLYANNTCQQNKVWFKINMDVFLRMLSPCWAWLLSIKWLLSINKFVVELYSNILNLSVVAMFRFCSCAIKNHYYSSLMPKRTCNIFVKIRVWKTC